MYIDNTELIKHVELCDVEENKESEEEGEKVSCPYSQPMRIEAHIPNIRICPSIRSVQDTQIYVLFNYKKKGKNLIWNMPS